MLTWVARMSWYTPPCSYTLYLMLYVQELQPLYVWTLNGYIQSFYNFRSKVQSAFTCFNILTVESPMLFIIGFHVRLHHSNAVITRLGIVN